MIKTRITQIFAALVCILTLALPAAAAEIDCGSIYCFGTGTFSREDTFTGICITALPQSSTGTLRLGSRIIRAGDILTARQAEQLTFSSLWTAADQTARLEYLPIFEDHVAPCSAMTINIRGREDKAPVAEDSAGETYKNIPNTGRLKVTDPEGQALTYTVTRQPKRGTVTVSADGSFTYTPKKNKVGVDSFTFTAADPAGNVSREATVTITILKPTDAPQYTDTVNRECRFSAEWMKHTGIFVGESLGDQSCFQPDKAVTRGEFVTMLVKALDIPMEDCLTYTGYTDEIPTWLQPYLAAAVRSGLTAGLPNQDVFAANTPITGAEAAVLLCSALDLPKAQDVMVSQESTAPEWAAAALAAVNGHGFALEAELPLTREQAAQALYRSADMVSDSRSDPLV